MKKCKIFFLSLLLLFLPFAYAVEYTAEGELFVIDLDKDWQKAKSNDPSSVLRLEKGKDLIEISKLDDELSDFYLKQRLKEQVDELKNKGISSLSEIKTASIHSISNAYYVSYIQDSQTNIISFLTYSGNSYAIISKGLSEASFRDLIYFFRKPGEKVEIKKPKPLPPKKIRMAKKEKIEEKEEENIDISTTELETKTEIKQEIETSTSIQNSTTTANVEIKNIDQVQEAKQQAQKFVSEIAKKASNFADTPYIQRKPINKFLILSILVLWIVLSQIFANMGSKIPNPKLTPYPQEVPPDFFFPFIITRVSTSKETLYQIITRQKQILSASYNHENKFLCNLGIYGVIFLHIFWSLSSFVDEKFFTNMLLSLPFGKFISSFPELPFILILLFGIFKKMKIEQKLVINDSQMNLIMEVFKDKNFYAVLKDGKGKEVARLHKKGSALKREWYFTDLDNQVAFKIIDEHPFIYLASKIFGSVGGKLRNRYGLFLENKRIGFLFVDPNSKDNFQIHLEYDYARIAHPAQIMASVLYIISREKEKFLFSF